MRNPLLIPDLRELLQAGETEALREFFEDHHPAQIVEVMEDLGPGEADAVFRLLAVRNRAEVMSYFDPERQVEVVEALPPGEAADLLHYMPHDDRADLVDRLEEDKADEILRRLAHAEREDIRKLISYESGTAGAVMTTDYAALPPHITVREALERLRREAPERETILTSYVVDPRRHLIGSVSLQKLVLARPGARIEDVMQEDPIRAAVDDPRADVADKIGQYDLIAIPIVDAEGQLVGIVTHDDALDILQQERGDDLLAFGGVSPREDDEGPYWQGQILTVVRRRVVWLLLLFFGGTITGLVVNAFRWVDGRFPELQFETFYALLIGTGGNAGSQAVGTVIRGLALGEIEPADYARVLVRELVTGLLLGLLLGSLGFVITWLLWGRPPAFAIVIGVAILGICVWANGVGALVPLLARRLGADPALVSAPLISTLVDATGLVIFYSVAIAVLIHLAKMG